jgi:hypothetical protein
MGRKSAAQKARAAANGASTATKENPQRHANETNSVEDQPKPKKAKIIHKSDSDTRNTMQRQGAKTAVLPTTITTTVQPRKLGQTRTLPPEPPKLIPSKITILPQEADDPKLRAQYDIHTVNIPAGSKMETKIRQVLQAMKAPCQDNKKVLVALTAAAKAANKGISVAEVAKRELAHDDTVKIYQYTGCWTRLETRDSQHNIKTTMNIKTSDGTDESNAQAGEGDLSDDAFEDMTATDRKTVRNAVCLIIYLSMEPVTRLREFYGEQVHEPDKG